MVDVVHSGCGTRELVSFGRGVRRVTGEPVPEAPDSKKGHDKQWLVEQLLGLC